MQEQFVIFRFFNFVVTFTNFLQVWDGLLFHFMFFALFETENPNKILILVFIWHMFVGLTGPNA